ncbi:MAG: hypothetical protein KA383_07970 [Phycisphaerae bacterium]|nr:hypothetical protein [Phycisphaerae bacterium]
MNCQLEYTRLFACLTALVAAGAAPADDAIRRSDETRQALEYRFTPADEALLSEIQHACFLYFWQEVGQPARLVKDRKLAPVSSIAAVGFQLSSLPIGVERGWITRSEGDERARTALKALIERDDNKKFGIYLHYPDMNTGGLSKEGFEILASTVDHALLTAGAMTAAEYFGGEVARLVDRLIADTNWKAYAVAPGGFLSMGWKPDDPSSVAGTGKFIDAKWDLASDEERLIYFLAAAAPNAEHALAPEMYYRLKRVVKRHAEMPPFVVSWPGSLFTYFFSHCWIDYRSLDADDPAKFKVDAVAVDWFENSRRAVLTQRQRCIEQIGRFQTFAPDRWGLSACSARDGYIVPEVRPNLSDTDQWHEGTVAPYAAGSAIMFAPAEGVAALRAFRELKDADGRLAVWRDPNEGGYGLVDSFNLGQKFACDDYVGIDHGPLLLAIENARTGLIWKLFMRHQTARRGLERLRLRP